MTRRHSQQRLGGGQAPSATATSDPGKDEPARSANETLFNFILDYSEGSLDASQVLPEQALCPSCMKLPDTLVLSGWGYLWEFYHFMIDFAPVLLEHVSQRGHPPQCTVLYGNGRFLSMENPQKKFHIRQKWEFFFGTPFNLKYEWKGEGPLPAKCPEVNWWPFWGNWASGPAKRFVDLRTHAHQLAGVSPTPPAGVILIKRGTLGQQKRNIADTFYDAAAKALDNRGMKYEVIDMEVMSMQDQVTKFANANVVVGQHGAGLSNINWMKNGTTVIELGQKVFPCYQNLARAIKLNYVTGEPYLHTSELREGLLGTRWESAAPVLSVSLSVTCRSPWGLLQPSAVCPPCASPTSSEELLSKELLPNGYWARFCCPLSKLVFCKLSAS